VGIYPCISLSLIGRLEVGRLNNLTSRILELFFSKRRIFQIFCRNDIYILSLPQEIDVSVDTLINDKGCSI
jgi:hypothetical protein